MMTFEEWWAQKDRVYANEYSTFKSVAAEAWEARVPEGYVLVPVDHLKQIEDAIAFEKAAILKDTCISYSDGAQAKLKESE